MAELTVASTTDTQQEINQAAGAVVKEEPEARPEPEEAPTPDVQVSESEPGQKPGKSKSAYQRRIDKLTREVAELKAKQAPQPAAELEAEPEPAPQTLGRAKPTPTPDKYETYEDYIEDLTDWKAEQRELQRAEQEQAAAQQQQLRAVIDNWNEQADAAREQYDDFDETLSNQVPIYAGVQMALMELENGAEVAYYLGKHRDVAAKLMEMSPERAIAEVGKLAANLGEVEVESEEPSSSSDEGPQGGSQGGGPAATDRAAPPPRRAVSNAPAPIKPVGGSATRSSVPLDELPYSEYRRIRDQQQKNRYRR